LATYLSYPAPYNRKAAQPSISLRPAATPKSLRRTEMLWTITIILFILWVLGLVSSYTLGGWIHILLVLAVIVLIFNLLSGRRAL
jgi:hypothetical protein